MTLVRAWKFLDRGAIGPFTGYRWPVPERGAPGAWVEAEGALVACERGVHACREQDLAFWIGEELWSVELDGPLEDAPDGVIARRGRLVERHVAFEADLEALCDQALARTRALPAEHDAIAALVGACGMLHGMKGWAGCAYIACVAAGSSADPSGADHARRLAAFRAERAWQSRFLAARLPR